MLKMRLLTFVLLLFVGLNLCADNFKLSGSIVDESGETVSYANVGLLSATDSTYVYGTTSNDAGHFSLTVASGKYKLNISCLGYEPQSQLIIVSEDINLGTIRLEKDVAMLKEVTVNGMRPTVTRNATGFVVSIEKSVALQNKNLFRILNVSPGVYVDKNGAISINGISGVTVVINDKTIRMTGDQLIAYLNSIQGSDLKNIEIMANPTSQFDAEGVGGVIRINTKRKRDDGLTGYVNGMYTYQDGSIYDGSGALTYSVKNISVYGNYNYNHYDAITKRSTVEYLKKNNILRNTVEYYNGLDNIHTYKAGFDWDISKSHYFGFEYNGYSSSRKTTGFTITETYVNDIYSGAVKANVPSLSVPQNNLFNINYLWTIDSLGQQLKFVADYSDVKDMNNNSYYYNDYYDANEILINRLNKLQTTNEAIKIYSAQLDYETKFRSKAWKLTSGLKYSNIETYYTFNMMNWNNSDDSPIEDARNKDKFKYNEQLVAAYFNLAYSQDKVDANVGLRGEYKYSKGISYVNNEENTTNKFHLFPSAFFHYKLNANHGLMAYYGMRIRRPSYEVVNPFIFYLTETSVKKGNPNLEPAIANSIELTYVLKNKYYFAFKAYCENNSFSTFKYVDNHITVSVLRNLSRKNNFYFTSYIPVNVGIWNSSNSMNIGLTETRGNEISIMSFDMMLRSRNYFQILKTLGAEFNILYIPPYKTVDIYTRTHLVKLDISLDYTFYKDKFNLTLGVDDILNTKGNVHNTYDYDDLSVETRYISSGRAFWIGLKYYIKAGKNAKYKNKDKSNYDEMNRL